MFKELTDTHTLVVRDDLDTFIERMLVRRPWSSPGLEHRRRRILDVEPLRLLPANRGSVESDLPSPQDSPLDLSMRAESPVFVPDSRPAYPMFSFGKKAPPSTVVSPPIPTKEVKRETKSYTCDFCGRSFGRSDMLTRHLRLHTGLKPYACIQCGQVFSRSDHLSTHSRTHTGEKPYGCPVCPYSACRRDMITRHLRVHFGSKSFVN